MKRILIPIMAGLMLTAATPAQANKSKGHTATTTVNISSSADKSANKKDTTTIEVFSDTTDTVDAVDSALNIVYDQTMNANNSAMASIVKEAFLPLAVVFTIFFLAPVAIIGLIVYLIIKSHKQKIRMAELAMQNGQPIPQEILRSAQTNIRPSSSALWEKGVRLIFMGIGLIVLFCFMEFRLGVGIGFFVAIYGCGQAFIGYMAKKKEKEQEELNGNNASDNDNGHDGASEK